ncbi:MAG: hypothetical protein JSV93_05295 [Candidatus Omnitrophota bacterium]|nr:MAG: hypothetical protein JSV93_05295 [Candidatus Omnitrophota bacterium]
MRKLLKYIIIAVTAFTISILCIDRFPQLIAIVGLSVGCIYFIIRNIDREMQKRLIGLFLIAFLLQVSISLFFYGKTVDTEIYGFSYEGDDFIYGDFGMIVGDLWRRGIFPSLKKLGYYSVASAPYASDIKPYQLYNAFIFYLFGTCGGQIILILNCFFHAAIIIPIYFICRDLDIKNNVMMFVFSLFLLWPSTFFWSLINLKESAMLFSVFAALALYIRMREKPNFMNILFLLFFIFIACSLRRYLVIVFSVPMAYFFISWKWRYKKVLILFFLLLLILIQVSAKPIFPPDLYDLKLRNFPQQLFRARYDKGISNTGYFANLLTPTYFSTALYFPFGVAAILFLPFLLRPFTLFHIVANIESIFWWSLLPFLLSGIWISMRAENLKKTFLILVTFFCWLSILALSQGNMGTLVRHKGIIYCIGFIFIGMAIDRTAKRISAYRDIGRKI